MRQTILISFVTACLTLLADQSLAAPKIYQASVLADWGYSSASFGSSGGNHVGNASPLGSWQHAVLWDGANLVDLHPAGFTMSEAMGTSGSQQVGYAGIANSGLVLRAMLWSGTATSAVELHPAAGYEHSLAEGISGNTQVGVGVNNLGIDFYSTVTHALMWKGTSESVVNLHPAGFRTSYARAVAGEWQAGYGKPEGIEHALLWHGSAASVVDLHPAGFRASKIYGMSEANQVGSGVAQNYSNHALLWRGSADSVVDLHPAGYLASEAFGASVDVQVGSALTQNSKTHAMAWNGTSGSAVDLHDALQDFGYDLDTSYAWGISENGDIVGYAQNRLRTYAIKWTLVPEPASIAFLVLAIPALIAANRFSRRK